MLGKQSFRPNRAWHSYTVSIVVSLKAMQASGHAASSSELLAKVRRQLVYDSYAQISMHILISHYLSLIHI